MPGISDYLKQGDTFRVSAATWNAIVDAAAAHASSRRGLGAKGGAGGEKPNMFLIKNASGDDRNRWDVLGISDILISPEDNQEEFENGGALVGVTPTLEHTGKFVICAESIPNNELGLAYISGACRARINVNSESDAQADVRDGDATKLESGPGPATILWKEAGTGTKWAVVRLGGGGSAPFLARVKPGTHYNNVCKVQPLQAGQHESAPAPAIDDSSAAEITGVVLRSSANLSGKYVWVFRLSNSMTAGSHRYMAVLADPIDAFYGCE